jgi:hypothetical protein
MSRTQGPLIAPAVLKKAPIFAQENSRHRFAWKQYRKVALSKFNLRGAEYFCGTLRRAEHIFIGRKCEARGQRPDASRIRDLDRRRNSGLFCRPEGGVNERSDRVRQRFAAGAQRLR